MSKSFLFYGALIYTFFFAGPCLVQLIGGSIYKGQCPYWPSLPLLSQTQGSLGIILFFIVIFAQLSFRYEAMGLCVGFTILGILIHITQIIICIYATIASFVESGKGVMQYDDATLSTYCHPKLIDVCKATSLVENILPPLLGCIFGFIQGCR
ncbi:unnamed protein product [Adineta ricciae]|uniref:Uncharacterized protein n=1 Tax=Adineta ricciae TaxID=249248 RepID=A0A815CNI5_ADIRI|nr:unnamed protein product [Adineta ricciae]CAF1439590.1 unnamed protein product [Adineta ricciae]